MPNSTQPRVSLILGGARSGKSRYAEALVEAMPGPWLYIATAETADDEMRVRVAEHRARRGTPWHTIEAPIALAAALADADNADPRFGGILVDCLTLWLSNIMLAGCDVEAEAERLGAAIDATRGPLVVVSNEVGLGIVPDNALARQFRDAQGRLNARIASIADRAVLMTAGLPLKLK